MLQWNPIPSNDKTVVSVQRGESGDHDDRGESVAFNENDSEDLRLCSMAHTMKIKTMERSTVKTGH